MKTLLLCILVVFITSLATSQDNGDENGGDKPNVRPAKINPLKGAPLRDRLYVGGDLNFNYGQNFLFFGISPFVGYKLTENFSVGAGVTSTFDKLRIKLKTANLNSLIFNQTQTGLGIFAEINYKIK